LRPRLSPGVLLSWDSLAEIVYGTGAVNRWPCNMSSDASGTEDSLQDAHWSSRYPEGIDHHKGRCETLCLLVQAVQDLGHRFIEGPLQHLRTATRWELLTHRRDKGLEVDPVS
jgi:hypothetical protein